ncbi:DUF2071 domain-containing protein [Akkermansiaceae bacterium]|nr:DUF2071 domain-containing protein [Akkermansiaceae bacterium]MDB4537116.1 DUF2071 domain-containing protein [Akkermansiaceae bacterium]
MGTPAMSDRLSVREKPPTSPAMFQRWSELLFLHWEIDQDLVRARLPESLTVDTYEGKTYLGLVPFFMQKVRPRFLPTAPWLSNFLELNVRVYVHDQHGRPGVWFFSLDCNQPIAVELARRFFHLPYQHASMTATADDFINYTCHRKGEEHPASYRYQGEGEVEFAEPGSFEFFLLERYLLFSTNRKGDLFSGQVHHTPYPFQKAAVPEWSDEPLLWEGVRLERPPISALYSRGVDVDIHPLHPVTSG